MSSGPRSIRCGPGWRQSSMRNSAAGSIGSDGSPIRSGLHPGTAADLRRGADRMDEGLPREGRRLIYDTLTDTGVNFTWHEFNGQHAFLRDEGPRYDPELAGQTWNLILAMLHRSLHTV